jgi:hypothetical protein
MPTVVIINAAKANIIEPIKNLSGWAFVSISMNKIYKITVKKIFNRN